MATCYDPLRTTFEGLEDMRLTASLRDMGIGIDILEGRYMTGFRISRRWLWLRAPMVGEVQWLSGHGWAWDRWSEAKNLRVTGMLW